VRARDEGTLSGLARNRIRAAVHEAIAARQIPGAVVLVARGRGIVYHEAFGRAQIVPASIHMRRDTIFDLASLTKPLCTGLALGLLAERGRLALRDPVVRWLPRFRGSGKEGVTLLDLATHSGGLTDAGLYDPAAPMVTTAGILSLLWRKSLAAPPRTRYVYADYNYIALGLVVEAAAREPLDRFFAREIARPLGLADTGFKPSAARRSRCAATAVVRGRMLRGTVHDPRAHDLNGVAGHAGLFGTARDVAVIPRMLLAGGWFRGRRFCSPDTAAMITGIQSPAGLRPRMLGWDSDPEGAGPRGDLFPRGGFGHTGFTGTSVWADPGSGTVVVILSNRVHPDGRGSADPLRARIANIVAGRLGGPAGAARGACGRVQSPVLTGIDVLEREAFARIRGKRIGLVTNLAVLNRAGRTTLDVLRRAHGVTLAAVFSPEHGLEVRLDEKIPSGGRLDARIPVHSLYGDSLRPIPAQLRGLDLLLVDLPDIGVRFYTYPATTAYCMEASAKARLPVMVLDRPNPITGLQVEGPLLPKSGWGFTGYADLPVRHGMTLGELARFFNTERGIGANLSVVAMDGWRRESWFDETGLPWANPSPNIRTLTQAILYPAVGMLERTNLSVGRGTDAPFEHLGAPWLNGVAVARELSARQLPGVGFYPATFTPASGPHAGVRCGAVRLQLTDREAFRPVLTGLTVADVLARVHGGTFMIGKLDDLLGVPDGRARLVSGVHPDRIASGWALEEAAFIHRRRPFLLY